MFNGVYNCLARCLCILKTSETKVTRDKEALRGRVQGYCRFGGILIDGMLGRASLRDTKWRGNLEGLRDVGLLRFARNDGRQAGAMTLPRNDGRQ